MVSADEKKALVSKFILKSPPGEVNDVFNDVRVLLEDDGLLQESIVEPFEQYNKDSFLSVKLPNLEHEVVISKFGELESGRFYDPKSKQAFSFDHVRQVVSNVGPHTPNEETEPFREALETEVEKYVNDHYPNGVVSVYGREGKKLHIAVVDNKYNPNNFWNGRWTSQWTVELGKSELSGQLRIQVHYYEDGNVQLNTSKTASVTLSSASDPQTLAAAVVKAIAKNESDFQLALNESYVQLSDSIFKTLRRALPITRTRIDWHALSNYKIGAELSKK